VYIRSFADSNADGVGDIRGVIGHLGHLEWLGIDGIWLSPVMVSPNVDWGYDVSNYLEIQPDLGTSGDLDLLISQAAEKGIRVLLDLIPNHTSDQNQWFVESRSSAGSPFRDWYVWADPSEDGSPPNNWASSCGGPAWTFDPATGQYFLHNHLPEQPDLNWWNGEVRVAFERIMRNWFERGIAGFRIDVCNIIIKDAELRDNPPSTDDDDLDIQLLGQRPVYNSNRPEVHEVLKPWRRLADSYDPPRLLVGETPVKIESLAEFYGDGTDELHLAFNFPFISAAFDAKSLRGVVEDTEFHLPAGAWPAWTGSNHDMGRFSTRWADGDPQKARLALLMLLCLRGTPVLYQGDEVGLCESEVGGEDLRDPLGVMYWPAYNGRDPMRTPMQWSSAEGAGFTDPGIKPWLPIGNASDRNVETQMADPGSMLWLARDLISLRRGSSDLTAGSYKSLDSEDQVWCFARGDHTIVALNLGDDPSDIEGLNGSIRISTDRHRDGEPLDGAVVLQGWQGIVIEAP
jgi:alpha-glucosidase